MIFILVMAFGLFIFVMGLRTIRKRKNDKNNINIIISIIVGAIIPLPGIYVLTAMIQSSINDLRAFLK